MDGQASPKLVVGIKEAAHALSLSVWTVRKYVANGKIRPVRIGSRVLVELSELQRLVDEGRQK